MASTNFLLGNNSKRYLILIFFTAANFWIWQIFSNNLVLGFILLTLELGLFFLSTQKNLEKKYKKALSISIFFVLVLSAFLLIKNNFDKTLSSLSPTEVDTFNRRHSYLAEGLGKVLGNRYLLRFYRFYGTTVSKYERNIFYSLDPNLYFYRSHPREKVGIDEYNKYSPFVLPFFVIGILFLIIFYRDYKFLIAYFIGALLATGFISPNYRLGPVLIFPFMNIILYFGFAAIVAKVKPLLTK
jgi:hypothetical protein